METNKTITVFLSEYIQIKRTNVKVAKMPGIIDKRLNFSVNLEKKRHKGVFAEPSITFCGVLVSHMLVFFNC